MLVGRGVEHHLRRVAREHLAHPRRRLGVADHRRHRQLGEAVAELLLDRIQRELRELEQDQLARRVARDLAAQLRADRAAGAGHQHPLAAQQPVQPGVVELHRVAPEQVVELDVAQGRDAYVAGDDVAQRGHGHHLDACGSAQVDGALAHAVARARHGDDRPRDAVARRQFAGAVDRAEYLDAQHCAALLGDIVVEQPDDAPAAAVREVLDQRRPGAARTEHEHWLGVRMRNDAQEALFLPRPVHEPAAAHRADQEYRREQIHRSRHVRPDTQQRKERRNRERPDAHRGEDALQVGQAGEAPQAAVEAQHPEQRRVDRQDPRQPDPHHMPRSPAECRG